MLDHIVGWRRRYFASALKKAKIDAFRFHDLRHTFASHFIMKTGDLPALQKLLGHYSPQMTQRYAYLAKGHLASEMQIFDSSMPISALGLVRDGHYMDTSLHMAALDHAKKVVIN